MPLTTIEDEFEEFEGQKLWPTEFWDIQKESGLYELSTTDAKDPANKGLNRYRDIHPYNHTRIKLQRGDVSYINASLIEVPSSKRKYILTQGPLIRTVGHFWQMVWEQNTKAIIMLNNFVENHQQKCADYFPRGNNNGNTDEVLCEDTLFKVTYLKQDRQLFFTVRTLLLEDLVSQKTKEILHFHYTRWSDFSVPQSPAAFLRFLHHVRKSGSLDDNVGPPVIHCSAGVGRSGTFCLVDSSLVQIENDGNTSGINLKKQLLDMRRYRLGLIQTWQQLRFSYCAVLEGSRVILRGDSLDSLPVEDSDFEAQPPPLPPKRPQSRAPPTQDGQTLPQKAEENSTQDNAKDVNSDGKTSIQAEQNSRVHETNTENKDLRKRKREEKNAKLNEKLSEMRRKQRRSEYWQQKRSLIRLGVGVGIGVAAVSIVLYLYMAP